MKLVDFLASNRNINIALFSMIIIKINIKIIWFLESGKTWAIPRNSVQSKCILFSPVQKRLNLQLCRSDRFRYFSSFFFKGMGIGSQCYDSTLMKKFVDHFLHTFIFLFNSTHILFVCLSVCLYLSVSLSSNYWEYKY